MLLPQKLQAQALGLCGWDVCVENREIVSGVRRKFPGRLLVLASIGLPPVVGAAFLGLV